MNTVTDKILLSLVFGLVVGLLGSAIVGFVLNDPSLVASKLSVAHYVAGACSGSTIGKSLPARTFYATVGALGAILGWMIYRGMVI